LFLFFFCLVVASPFVHSANELQELDEAAAALAHAAGSSPVDPNAPAPPPADPSSALLHTVLMVDSLNNVVEFDPSKVAPGQNQFLLTLQKGIIAKGVKNIVFTATAVNPEAKMTIQVNQLAPKPYVSTQPIQVELVELTTKGKETSITLGITSVDKSHSQAYYFLIPPCDEPIQYQDGSAPSTAPSEPSTPATAPKTPQERLLALEANLPKMQARLLTVVEAAKRAQISTNIANVEQKIAKLKQQLGQAIANIDDAYDLDSAVEPASIHPIHPMEHENEESFESDRISAQRAHIRVNVNVEA